MPDRPTRSPHGFGTRAIASASAPPVVRQTGTSVPIHQAAAFDPGLPSHPQAAVVARVLHTGGGMLAVDLGTRATAGAFIDALTIPPRTASLGSVHTLAVHPPSHTHRQLDDAGLVEAGIAQGLVRVSVGLEDADDLAADFTHALDSMSISALA